MTTLYADVWTLGYFPMTMGGRVWRPMRAKIPVTGPHDLGKGFEGYLCLGPGGATEVAESTSGAIVGDTLEAVRADIAACDDVDLMRKQCQSATARLTDVVDVEPDDWWRRILKATT